MLKDAFYFPHYINARNDQKVRRVRRDLGAEGYAIFFMALEVLREESDLMYPFDDLDILADEFKVSVAKLQTVVCNYGLFKIIETKDGKKFFSPKQIDYLEPFFAKREQARNAGKKSGEARRLKNKQQEALLLDLIEVDSTEQPFNKSSTGAEQQTDRQTKKKIETTDRLLSSFFSFKLKKAENPNGLKKWLEKNWKEKNPKLMDEFYRFCAQQKEENEEPYPAVTLDLTTIPKAALLKLANNREIEKAWMEGEALSIRTTDGAKNQFSRDEIMAVIHETEGGAA